MQKLVINLKKSFIKKIIKKMNFMIVYQILKKKIKLENFFKVKILILNIKNYFVKNVKVF